jgi:hypothetical protein
MGGCGLLQAASRKSVGSNNLRIGGGGRGSVRPHVRFVVVMGGGMINRPLIVQNRWGPG